MTDEILAGFLERQLAEGMALAAESDVLTLLPIGGPLPQRYLADFRCRGLVRLESGAVVEADHFVLGVVFDDNYLRDADPFRVLTCLAPPGIYHPNVTPGAPFICVGPVTPGTPLVDLLYRSFEVFTYQRVTMREDNALNVEACAWARRNLHRFPIDDRPLKRSSTDFGIEIVAR
jgi:hypothetical protein